jgi:hypothetical protein
VPSSRVAFGRLPSASTRAGAFALLVLLAGCIPGFYLLRVLPEVPCTAVAASTEGWEVLDRPHFTLRLPPDARRVSYQEFELDGLSLRVAFSSWEGRTGLGASGPNSSECFMEIGGHDATIVTWWMDALRIQAAWGPIVPGPFGDMGLSVSFRARGTARYEDMVAIIRSVRFKPVEEG